MANDLNLCQFIGNLGQDPEMRQTPDGTAVCNISIACNWKSKDKQGTEWVRVVAFGKLAEIMGQYLRKGSKVYVSGQMKTRKWQGQDGQDRYTTEIAARDLQMLDGRGGQDSGSGQPAPTGGAPAAADDFDNDIPFD